MSFALYHGFFLLVLFGSTFASVQLRRLMLSETVVNAVRPLCRVSKVADVSSCAQLCLREAKCAAVRYRSSIKQCDLLTARFDGLEGAVASADVSGDVEVWAIIGRGFGECPLSYTASWRSSRYRLSTTRAAWLHAERECRAEGGKLAELTTPDEMSAVVQQMGTSVKKNVLIGGSQAAGAEETAGGWSWYRSGLPISSSMWNRREPNNNLRRQHVAQLHLLKDALVDRYTFQVIFSFANVSTSAKEEVVLRSWPLQQYASLNVL